MIIAVGSTNKTKLDPVKNVFSHYFKNVKIVGVKVTSGVSEQPTHEDEIFTGALNRAKNALTKIADADYGVGIEGGLHQHSFGWIERSTIVIVNRKGDIGIGLSAGLVQPKRVMDKIHAGKNLEEAIDELFGTKKIGEGIGAYGMFTKGLVTRASGMQDAIAFALARFLHEEIYEEV